MQGSKEESKSLDDLIDKELTELLKVCKHLRPSTAEELAQREVKMGLRKRQKVLILDMDETMLHAQITETKKDMGGDYIVPLEAPEGNCFISVKIRPYLFQCMEHLSKYYEIVVFTAGEQTYADAILDQIDAENQIISKRIYRDSCINPAPGVYVKDLRVITDRAIEDIVIVDNSIISFAYNMDNGVPISAFFTGMDKDEELLYMVGFLEQVYAVPDVRTKIKETFKLQEYMNQL